MFKVTIGDKELDINFLHYGEGVTSSKRNETEWKKKFKVFTTNWEMAELELNTARKAAMEINPKKKLKLVDDNYPKVGTVCFILIGEIGSKIEDKEELSIGNAQKHANDVFSRASGRKYSLAKALKNTSFSDEEKRKIWYTYFPLCKDTRNLVKRSETSL